MDFSFRFRIDHILPSVERGCFASLRLHVVAKTTHTIRNILDFVNESNYHSLWSIIRSTTLKEIPWGGEEQQRFTDTSRKHLDEDSYIKI